MSCERRRRGHATAQHCEVQLSELAPPVSVRAAPSGTRYHMHFTFDDEFRAGLGADLQQPHPARSGSAGRVAAVEDDADAQRDARPDDSVHDHVHERHRRAAVRRRARRPLPGGLPLHRGFGTYRRRADRADARGPRAHVERSGRLRQSASFDRAAAGGRRRRERRRVHEPRSGNSRADEQPAVERGRGDGARHSRCDVRLHGPHRQGVRRCESQRHSGRGRTRTLRRASRQCARPARRRPTASAASTSRARSCLAKVAAATSS